MKIYEECLWIHSYLVELHRNSHRRCSKKKVFLKILQNSQENTCARVSFSEKLADRGPATVLKKRLWHKSFPVNFVKFLRTSFLNTTSGVASSFPSSIYDFFIHICLAFDKIKLTKGKLFRGLRPVVKYKFKERD